MGVYRYLRRLVIKSDAQTRLLLEDDIEQELLFHLEMRQRDNEAAGMSSEEAEKDAHERFGDVSKIRAKCLSAKTDNPIHYLLNRAQMISGLAVSVSLICMAFILFNAVQFKPPLTYHDGEPWSSIWWQYDKNRSTSASSVSDYYQLAGKAESFEVITAARYKSHYLGSYTGSPQRIRAKHITPAYFAHHGAHLYVGQDFLPEDYASPLPEAAILSYALWNDRFNRDREIIGKTLVLDGQPVTIRGVAPPSFRMYFKTDLFVPLLIDSIQDKTSPTLLMGGQLKQGITQHEAETELRSLTSSITGKRVLLRHVRDVYASPLRQHLVAYLWIASLFLFLACVHFIRKQLFFTYEQLRIHGTSHSLRQLFKQHIVVIVPAVAVGLVIAGVVYKPLFPLFLGDFNHLFDARIDTNVYLFGLGLVLLLCASLCLIPWVIIRFKGMHKQSITPVKSMYGLSSMIEISCITVICIIAILQMQNVWLDYKQSPGFNAEDVLSVELSMPDYRIDTPQSRRDFMMQVFQKVDSIPAIKHASLTSALPDQVQELGVVFSLSEEEHVVRHHVYGTRVGIDYLQIVRIPLHSGRYFDLADLESPLSNVIINQALADQHWPTSNPVGETIYLGKGKHPVTVIGVVGNVAPPGREEIIQPSMYFLFWGATCTNVQLLLKTKAPQHEVLAEIRKAVWSIDSEIPLSEATWLPSVQRQQHKKHWTSLFIYFAVALGSIILGVNCVIAGTRQSIEWYIHQLGLKAQTIRTGMFVWLHVFKDQVIPIFAGVLAGILATQGLLHSGLLGFLELRHVDLLHIAFLTLLMLITLLVTALAFSTKASQVDERLALRFG